LAIKEGKWLLINKIHQYLKSMNESVFQYAGFWRRFEAMLIDSFILLIFQLVIVVSLVCGAYVKVGYWPFEEVVNQLGSLIDVLWFILIWVYFAGMESSSTQATFGKMVLGLQVTDIEGNRISFLRATGRNMAKILSTAILSIGYLMAAFTKKKQALHDLAADCLVNKQKESSFWKLVFIAILFAVLLTGAIGAYVYYIKWPQWVKATEEAFQDAEEILLDPEKMFEPSTAPVPEKTKVVKESSASAGTDLKECDAMFKQLDVSGVIDNALAKKTGDCYESAIKSNPNNADAYYRLGKSQKLSGFTEHDDVEYTKSQYKKAQANLKKAIELNPSHKKAEFELFMLEMSMSDSDSRVSLGEITVERIREFVCDMSGIGKQADIAFMENGDEGETVFIRPADQECHFHLFHRSASGDETQLSSDPGGYQIVQASVLDDSGVKSR